MASASPWEEMEETFFTCSICLNNFEDPKQLPCLHRYCRMCLKPIVEKHKKSFNCPLCKFDCKIPPAGVDGFRSDFHSKNIIQFIRLQKTVKNEEIRECVGCSKEAKVTAHCFKCVGFLCEGCFQFHQTSGMLRAHRENVLTLENITTKKLTFEKLMSLKQPPPCSEHPEKLAEICCGSCGNIPICIVCGHHEKHQGHKLHGVKILAEKERRAEEIQARLQACEDTVHQMPKEIEDAKKTLQANMAAKKRKLQKQYDREEKRIKAEQARTEAVLKKHKEDAVKAEQKEVDELERKRQEEIQAINEKFDKLISDIKLKNKRKQKEKTAPEDEHMVILSETSSSLDKKFKELKEFLDNQGRQNTETLSDLLDDSVKRINRFDNYKSTLKSILSSCDDWTDVRSLPEINAVGEPLIGDAEKGNPEIKVLSDVLIDDLTTDIPKKLSPPPTRPIRVGDKVRVKTSVLRLYSCRTSMLKEGSIGVVTRIRIRGHRKICTVDFPEHRGWMGVISEMELAQ